MNNETASWKPSRFFGRHFTGNGGTGSGITTELREIVTHYRPSMGWNGFQEEKIFRCWRFWKRKILGKFLYEVLAECDIPLVTSFIIRLIFMQLCSFADRTKGRGLEIR